MATGYAIRSLRLLASMTTQQLGRVSNKYYVAQAIRNMEGHEYWAKNAHGFDKKYANRQLVREWVDYMEMEDELMCRVQDLVHE